MDRNLNEPSKKGLKTALIGIVASGLLALIKGLGGVFGHSYALIADAIESASDILTSAMLWAGGRLHHRSDAITSIAAFIGISIALIGGGGFMIADDFAALIAAGFIFYNAYKISRPDIGELLDDAVDPGPCNRVIWIAEKMSDVVKVERCRSRKMGTAFHIDMHIWVDGDQPVGIP